MVNEYIWGLPAAQSTQLTERSIPVVCHRCCHRSYLMRPYRRKVWFWWVLVGESNSLATHRWKWVVNIRVLGAKFTNSFCYGSSSASSWERKMYSPRILTGQINLSGSLLNKWAVPGNSKGFQMVSGRASQGWILIPVELRHVLLQKAIWRKWGCDRPWTELTTQIPWPLWLGLPGKQSCMTVIPGKCSCLTHRQWRVVSPGLWEPHWDAI